MRRIITLTTDFGLRDPYVSTMKAVIYRINPEAIVIDVSHEVESFNVRLGSYLMFHGLRYYPPGTIHVGIVHPEVGDKRCKVLIVEAGEWLLIAPNNGLLTIPLKEWRGLRKAYQVEEDIIPKKFPFIGKLSRTFWAGDVFAPVSASLSMGRKPEEFGVEIPLEKIVYFDYEKSRLGENYVSGSVLRVDKYGNVVTNIPESYVSRLFSLGERFTVKTERGEYVARLVESYSDGKENELIGIINEMWMFELAIKRGSANEILGMRIGDRLTVLKM